MNSEFLDKIISEFTKNRDIYFSLLKDIDESEYRWRQDPDKWCLLEILCHLYDEEREDFRTRFISVLKNPEDSFPPINPPGWVKERNYIGQDYAATLQKFINERNNSIKKLQELSSPELGNTHHHPKIGPMSAKMIISNWLAHDYLHIKQIIKLKYDYVKKQTGENLLYAGNW